MKLSIIVPVYNEEKTISKVLTRLFKLDLDEWKKEIIVVDDKSNDKTSQILSGYGGKINLIKHLKNLGKTAAIKSGLEKATGDYVIIQDADLEYNPSDIVTLVKVSMLYPSCVIYGSRFRGIHEDTIFGHKAANLFLTLVTNILYGTALSDMETCYKLFPKKFLKGISIEGKRFDFEPEITAKFLLSGIKIIEVPISYRKRDFTEGKKIRWYDGFSAVWVLIRCRIFC